MKQQFEKLEEKSECSLSEKDKAAFFMCQTCEWLKEIDYKKFKVYCLEQKCVKRGENNF